MQEYPGSDRETIETHSHLFQTSINPLKITCKAYSKKLHIKKTNIHKHISTYTEKTTPVMKLNQKLSLLIQSVHEGSPQVLYSALLAPE
jgi:hypothetical protein